MIRLVRQSLAFKLILLTALAVAAGFAAAVMTNAKIQAESVDRLHAENARSLAHTLAAGVRNSMLTGNGISVRNLVDDMQSGIGTAKVRVFAANGEEVFAAKPPAPPPEAQPAHVRAVLASLAPSAAPDGARAIPIQNEDRCHSCHEQGKLRGVMTLGTRGARVAVDASDGSLDALAHIFRAGFVELMTAKRDAGLDAYFAEVTAKTAAVRGVAVYDEGEQRTFGTLEMAVPKEAITRGVKAGEAPFTVEAAGLRYRVVPLPSESRCKGCHREPGEQMRGTMVVAFEPPALAGESTLMARFDGPDMEARAVKCAVERVDAVAALSKKEGAHAISIGVGVNAGDVVFGAMGAEHRMDHTVI